MKKLTSIIFAAALLLATSSPSWAADWSSFRGGQQRLGAADSTLSPPVSERWHFAAEGPTYSSPVISGNIAYIGSQDNNIYAIDITTGSKKWSFMTGGAVDSSPAVSAGKLYAASKDGTVYCLDAATGNLIWKTPLTGEHSSSILVTDGKVILGTGALETSVKALNADTGAVEWTLATGQMVYSSASVLNGIIYIGSNDGKIYAINPADGSKKWDFQTNGGIYYSSPAATEAAIFVAPGDFDRNIYSLDPADGKVLWSYKVPGEGKMSVSSPAADANAVYVSAGYSGIQLFALSPADGTLLWKANTGKATKHGFLSSPAVGKEYIWTGSGDGLLIAVDKTTGAEKVRVNVGAPILSSPALTADKILVATTDGVLYAFW